MRTCELLYMTAVSPPNVASGLRVLIGVIHIVHVNVLHSHCVDSRRVDVVVGRTQADGTDGEASGGGGGKEEKRRAACRDAFTTHVTTLTSGSCQIWQDGGLGLPGPARRTLHRHDGHTRIFAGRKVGENEWHGLTLFGWLC